METIVLCTLGVIFIGGLFWLVLNFYQLTKAVEASEAAKKKAAYEATFTDWTKFEQPTRKPVLNHNKGSGQ